MEIRNIWWRWIKERVSKLIDQLSMNSVIKLENFSDNPFYIFSNNSIYAMCSRTEGFGLVLAEAMACFGMYLFHMKIQVQILLLIMVIMVI